MYLIIFINMTMFSHKKINSLPLNSFLKKYENLYYRKQEI